MEARERHAYWIMIAFLFLLGIAKSYEVNYWYQETLACIGGER